jgi:hypothetical protein
MPMLLMQQRNWSLVDGFVVAIVAVENPASAGVVIFTGQEIVGIEVSIGVTVKAHSEALPCVSNTVMSIVVGLVMLVPAVGV